MKNSTSLYTFFFLSSPVSCNCFLAGQRKFLSSNEYIFCYAQFTKGVWDHPFVDLFSLIRVEQKKIRNLSEKAPGIGLLSDGGPIIGFYQGGFFFFNFDNALQSGCFKSQIYGPVWFGLAITVWVRSIRIGSWSIWIGLGRILLNLWMSVTRV